MSRYAVTNSEDIVENIIIAGENFTLEGKTLINVDGVRCSIGDRYEDGTFVPIEPEVVVKPPTAEERLEAVEMALLELL